MIKCDTCPRCKDTYPGKVDADGYHFHICGMSGNIVYTIPHKISWLLYGKNKGQARRRQAGGSGRIYDYMSILAEIENP